MIYCLIAPQHVLDGVLLNLKYIDPSSGDSVDYQFKLNYLMVIFACFRISYFGTSVLMKSQYMSPRSKRICKLYGTNPGLIFCLRSIFKDNPFYFIITIFLISVSMFTVTFRIAEYPVYSFSPITNYGNMIWMTIITMTTVGYGDFNPKTEIGRLISALCVSWGVFIVSVMVVVLS